MEKVGKTAKSLNEALELAAKDLGVAAEELSYEIVSEVGKGLMGFLVGREVTISAWVKEAEVVKKDNKKTTKAKAEVKQRVEKTERADRAEKTAVKKQPEAVAATGKASGKQAAAGEKVREPLTREELTMLSKEAEEYLGELLAKMGITAKAVASIGENNVINIDISGEKMGLLIGKRGDTLDAVQYLVTLYVNRNKKAYVKVNLDTENYRAKREETLVRLARGLENRVMRDRRSITLEPMSPYERRIIHSTLQGNARIRTYSVGEEPNRKIVVALK